MERISKKATSDHSRWVFNWHKLLDWIQTAAIANLQRFFNTFFLSPGVITLTGQTHLQCLSVVDNAGTLEVTIAPGAGLVTTGEVILLPTAAVDTSLSTPADGTWYLSLEHTTVADDTTPWEVERTPTSYPNLNTHTKDSYTLRADAAWPTGAVADRSLRLAQVEIAGGTITVTDARQQATVFGLPAAALNWLYTTHTALDKNGTTATEFRVGVDSLGLGNAGLPVVTEAQDPADPLNLRIYDINPVPEELHTGVADVTFRWGWQGLTGGHNAGDGANTLRVTGVEAGSMALDVETDALVGQRVYSSEFQSADNSYLIEGNTATTGGVTILTLEDAYADESVTESGYIIPDSDRVDVEVVPYYGSKFHEAEVANRQTGHSFTIPPETTFRLPLQRYGETAYYKARIKAYKGVNGASAWVAMTGGQYDPDHGAADPDDQQVVTYTVPFACQLPALSDTGAGISLTATRTGFQVSISGWRSASNLNKSAHEFEVARTTLDTLNWDDTNDTIHEFTRDSILDVSTTLRRKWIVGVRPRQNMQVVGTPQTDEVTSGAGGVAPGDIAVINNQEFNIQTYSGTVDTVTDITGVYLLRLSTIKHPAASVDDARIIELFQYLTQRTSVLVDNAGNEFLIIGQADYDTTAGTADIIVGNVTGDSMAPVTGAFTINTSERGRRVLADNSLSVQFESVEGYLDWDYTLGATEGNPAVLRVCQNSDQGKYFADSYTFFGNDGADVVPVDFEIIYAHGNLGILFDFYDSSQTNNNACVKGRFSLYMRPKMQALAADDRRTL